jgi:hypothetical protein
MTHPSTSLLSFPGLSAIIVRRFISTKTFQGVFACMQQKFSIKFQSSLTASTTLPSFILHAPTLTFLGPAFFTTLSLNAPPALPAAAALDAAPIACFPIPDSVPFKAEAMIIAEAV